jgi:subtilase family serine protease
MKRSIALLTVTVAAAALFLVFASSMPVTFAQEGNRVIVPPSSIVHPEDLGVRAHTNYAIVVPERVEIGDNGAPIAENPLSLACIYHMVKQTKGCPKTSKIPPTGGTKAIALVDAYDNPDAAADLRAFAAAYGYGTPNLKIVEIGNPSPDPDWALESSLDIEYAFGMAPNANIYLVEANTQNLSDLLAAEDKATELVQAAGGGEASNSWCYEDFQGENTNDSHFKGKGIVYFASSGDTGSEVCYPSASPFVVSIGGTTINRDGNGNFTYESGWSDGGGGPSRYEPRPSYQNITKKIVGSHRGTPDISGDADYPNSPVAVHAEYACNNGYGDYCQNDWILVGGTSVSSPTIAGIVNAAGTFNASSTAELTEVYKDYGNLTKYKADFTDITKGNNGHACVKGWDFCTGLGSPKTYKGK